MITLQVHYHVLKNSNKILLILKFKIKLWHGSVRETLLPANVQVHKVILPTKCKRTIVTRHTHAHYVTVTSIITKYSSLYICYKGKHFSTSKRNNMPYIGQAEWNESLFGTPPNIASRFLLAHNKHPSC